MFALYVVMRASAVKLNGVKINDTMVIKIDSVGILNKLLYESCYLLSDVSRVICFAFGSFSFDDTV